MTNTNGAIVIDNSEIYVYINVNVGGLKCFHTTKMQDVCDELDIVSFLFLQFSFL